MSYWPDRFSKRLCLCMPGRVHCYISGFINPRVFIVRSFVWPINEVIRGARRCPADVICGASERASKQMGLRNCKKLIRTSLLPPASLAKSLRTKKMATCVQPVYLLCSRQLVPPPLPDRFSSPSSYPCKATAPFSCSLSRHCVLSGARK